jgi:hypothetical protein
VRFARCVAAIACALAAAGCSGSGSDESQEPGDTSSTPTIESDPTESVSPTDPATTADSAAPSDADAATVAFEQWVDAYVRSDGPTACALQTDEYTSTDLQQSIDSGVISPGTSCEDGVVAGAALARAFGFDFADPSIKPTSARRDKVTLAVKFHGAPQEVFVMTLEDGTWLVAREIDKSD